ncbi:glycoside hydrolase family 2 protein [Streptomyces corynorhini]|uniref:Beta-galactosidase n=1 Tax=Streptomyces corynorhini TaxID=2282652 RepID=A0A370BDA3_9ACTN|nr:glycoside hydrolase family 2 TIM barrel-domain containing protein [Streptomyces corynorhini]RDG39621.1 beta-galactosidase [Streptomyces corynorhini]
MRHRSTVNRAWRFALGEHPGAQREDFDDAHWQEVGLPHSFSLPYFQEQTFYIGAGWYRRTLTLDERQLSGVVRLDFEGAFQTADIYVNGVLAGRHEGGYTGFAVDIGALARPGANSVAVRVDNTWHPEIAPLAGEHAFSGGLYRDVWLDTMSPLHVDWYGTRVTTPGLDRDEPSVCVETEVRNAGERPVRARLITRVLAPDDTVVATLESEETEWPSGVTTVTRTSGVLPGVRLWSPETPVLYRAVSLLVTPRGETADRYETLFGFRHFAWTADRGFFLNGAHRYLLGANVHQDQAGWGDAVTNRSIRRDLELIGEAGFDLVRGSHYPHDPAFATYADELGLLVWSEGVFWGTGPGGHSPWSGGAYPVAGQHRAGFENSVRTQLAEMIRINRNSPSVVAWSMGNEAFFCDPEVLPEVRRLLGELVALSHALDPTRPAAVGGAQRGEIDRIGDIAGYNGDGAWMYPDPGVASIVSEYGSVMEDRPGSYGPGRGELTEGAGPAEDDPFPWRYPWRSGEVIWCGFDHGSIAGRRFGSMGIVDYARLPKRSWYWYRDAYRNVPPPVRPEPGEPRLLLLDADRTTLESSDGTDDLHLTVTLADAGGVAVSNSAPVTLTIESGPGEFATGRRIRFGSATEAGDDSRGACVVRDGRAAAFFRSYHAGTTRIRATSPGLGDAVLDVETVDGPAFEGPSGVPLDRAAPPGAAHTAPSDAAAAPSWFGRDNPTRASSSAPGVLPRWVNDGSPATHWAPGPDDHDPWVAVDLERLVTVGRVDVVFPEPGPHRFVVEASTDRTTWTVIADRTARERPSTSRSRTVEVAGITALQVRVRLLPTEGLITGVTGLSVLGRL